MPFMNRSNTILLGKCAVALAVAPAIVIAFSGGAPTRHTGAPRSGGTEATCAECHTGTAVGTDVRITYSGGTTYTPGERGRFTVTVNDTAGRTRFGLSASARLVSNLASAQAGTLVAGSSTRVDCEDDRQPPCQASAPVQFITHRSPFSANTIEFEWDPPAAGAGDVRVFVAVNAANGNGTNTGDRIHTANITLTPSEAQPGNRPAISQGGVADTFNGQPGVALNGWISIYGTNLSTTTRTWDGSPEFAQGRLPVSLDGVSVTVNGRAAPVYFVSPGQVNVLAPTDDSTGDVPVVLRNASGESAPMTARRSRLLPALYAPFGQGGRLFVTGVENSSGAILGKSGVEPRATRAFRPGDVVQFYASGLGPTNPAIDAATVVSSTATLVESVTMRINNVPVQVLGSAYVGSGLYQINATIPDVPNGDQPIEIEVGGVRSANTLSITIQR
jgi:uncharacterized protein (TIGR03437 family)